MTEWQTTGPVGQVWAAALTPLTPALEPDRERAIGHARWLLAHGANGVLMLGTTGEANSIAFPERLALIESMAAAMPTDRLMIGIGSPSLGDAVALAKASISAGCSTLLALPPYYYKNASEEGLYAYYAQLIDRVGAGRLRLLLYHIPQHSGVPLSFALVQRLVTSFPGTVVGLKDSAGDWPATLRLIQEMRGLAIYSGAERFLRDNLRAGGAGGISSAANVMAPLLQRVVQAWRTEAASPLVQQVIAARQALEGVAHIPALKALTRRRTGDGVWRRVLPPFLALTAAEEQALVARLEQIGFFTHVPEMAPA